MFNHFARHITVIRWVALALLVACLPTTKAYAQSCCNQWVFGVEVPSLGIARGQTLRYSWAYITRRPRSANLNDIEPEFEPLRVQATLFGADGSVIAQADTTAVSPEQIQSLDFNRGRINVPGEPGTGRLQAQLEVKITVRRGIWITDTSFERAFIKSFADVVEIIDDTTGRTTVGLGGGKNALSPDDSPGSEFENPKDFQVISAGQDRLFGLAQGQTVRFTTFNPNNPVSTEPTRQVSLVQVMLLDASGTQIAQSDEIAIPPGESRSIDFNRDTLPLTGGRVQIRAHVRHRFFSIIDRTQLNATTSIELLDTTTGRSTVSFPAYTAGINVASSDVND